MKRTIYLIPLLMTLILLCFGYQFVNAAVDPTRETKIPTKLNPDGTPSTQLVIPQNTSCRAIDFTSDIKRTNYSSEVWDRFTFNGVDSSGNRILDIYDLCLGSFPRYPSTSVEGGVEPYYYLKYRLIPDPMPVYEITTTPEVINGSEIIGINQEFTIDASYEAKDKPSDEDIFLFYPYNKEHVSTDPVPKNTIRGPYQIGYNSFFHNTYRARYFASQVKFDFDVLEPKKESTYLSHEGVSYPEKTLLFSGEIIYDIPESCYETQYLDYKENCREIEFYFPKGDLDADDREFIGDVENTTSSDEKSTNVIPKKRLPYMNPGEHNLIVNVTENTQLRLQKDYGTEYQTVGNQANTGSISGIDPWENYVVYFGRHDKQIAGSQEGNPITPLNEIKQISTHNGKKISSNTIRDSGKMATTAVSGGEYEYNPSQNEDWMNYCDYNTDNWGNKNTTNKPDNSGGTTSRTNQSDTACFHNDGKDTHFFQYNWSDTTWYPQNPRPPL